MMAGPGSVEIESLSSARPSESLGRVHESFQLAPYGASWKLSCTRPNDSLGLADDNDSISTLPGPAIINGCVCGCTNNAQCSPLCFRVLSARHGDIAGRSVEPR